MKQVYRYGIYYVVAFAIMLLGGASLFLQGDVASGQALNQTVPGDGTVPPTATPSSTLPVPACPAEVKAPEEGKIVVFLGPVAIFSGCEPQVQSAALMTDTGFVPTILYHNPDSGFPEALGYMGEPYATFEYSAEELARLITVLESFRCEEVGMPLAPCRQVNGIRISSEGYALVNAAQMRFEAATGIDTQNSGRDGAIYLPVSFTK
ncbi:MAG: hypothetical protein H6645_04040 [Caldilineaceae bacterium]|nr:hypothetical protein [Caldilineaceae bacterium]